MSPSLKKICVFGLAVGLGKMILKQVDSFGMEKDEMDLVVWNSNQIIAAGEIAIEKSHVRVDLNKMKQVSKKIDQVCKDGDEFDVVKILSFLFLGLNDLSHHCKNKDVIKVVEDAALNFTTLYDPNLENESLHAAALEKYQNWIEMA